MDFTNIFLGMIVLTNFVFLSSYETFGEQSTTIKITPIDDAHVLADLNDPADSQGLMQTNAGSLESIQLLSAWNVTEGNNAFVTIGYLKFDVSQQKTHNLEKAELKMLTQEVILSEMPKNVALLHVSNNNWNESDITYLNRPSFSTTITSVAAISAQNTWYSWDVTDLLKQNPGSDLSVALTFETAKDKTQDFVSFYSKDYQDKDYSTYLALYYAQERTPLDDFNFETSILAIIVISGITSAVVGGFVAKFVFSRGKHKTPKPVLQQQNIHQEKIQCKTCGKMLPKQFKYCPFCSTQINQ